MFFFSAPLKNCINHDDRKVLFQVFRNRNAKLLNLQYFLFFSRDNIRRFVLEIDPAYQNELFDFAYRMISLLMMETHHLFTN